MPSVDKILLTIRAFSTIVRRLAEIMPSVICVMRDKGYNA
jgi:hypothetical protein